MVVLPVKKNLISVQNVKMTLFYIITDVLKIVEIIILLTQLIKHVILVMKNVQLVSEMLLILVKNVNLDIS